jgi:hypothetical protein
MSRSIGRLNLARTITLTAIVATHINISARLMSGGIDGHDTAWLLTSTCLALIAIMLVTRLDELILRRIERRTNPD